jgi:hypothetical protein
LALAGGQVEKCPRSEMAQNKISSPPPKKVGHSISRNFPIHTLCSPLQIMCGIVAIFGSTEQPQTLRKKIVAMVSKRRPTLHFGKFVIHTPHSPPLSPSRPKNSVTEARTGRV